MRPVPVRPGSTRRTAVLGAVVLSLPLLASAASAAPPAAAQRAAAAAALAAAPNPNGVPAQLPSKVTVGALTLENSFVSSTGWVKPGQRYPSQVRVTNTGAPVSGLTVKIPPTRGMAFTAARSARGSVARGTTGVTWKLPTVPKGVSTLILQAQAKTLAQEPTVVWRNVSSVATATLAGTTRKVASHGPKVIPAKGGYETARFGDRPFPVVPVDYVDNKHTADHPADQLDQVINDPKNAGSTFNLYQEMSYGQLFPHGTIGSSASRGAAPKSTDGLKFSTQDLTQTSTCTGTSLVDPTTGAPSALYTQRVSADGWYQLPGLRGYYGSDGNGSAVVGSLTGVGALQSIDSGCGPAAKAAYDAAVVADPDIDYNDYDTDKDGVVDFFEVVFEGCGGNGSSQLSIAGGCSLEDTGDNIWPHSSSLENSYTDATTGLKGYVTKDRLKDLEGRPLFYTNNKYTKTTTTKTAFPAFVRVGPYNVNPETAIDFASVISHEYGHSLGLPDYYSTGSRETYGDFTLMATDQSQNMDIVGKKELGWVVPQVLAPGTAPSVTNWRDTKIDTGRITWQTPAGKPYTLTAGTDYGIHNGQAYVASLPGRQLISAAKFATGASGKQAWYSQQGNDFGCGPTGGHNLDVAIPGIEDLPTGTTVTAKMKSYWDMEWDFDYGFVLTGTPDTKGAYSYASVESQQGYTTDKATNPNNSSCQSGYGNGITGSSGAYKVDGGNPAALAVDRGIASDYKESDTGFLADSYDISSLAGVKGGVLRFSYATDPGVARTGWLIDDLEITATTPSGAKTLLKTDFEGGDGGPADDRFYPGGCKEDLTVSGGVCTTGWGYIAAGTPSELEHAYLLEMRDRSGFDYDGRGEADRGGATFEPGVLLTYTDESHGYGNVGTDNPPAQSPLDSTPTPESDTPELGDAAFTAASGRSTYTDARANPHVDNYTEPTRSADKDQDGDGVQPWVFDYDCLSFKVNSLTGNADNTTTKYDLVGNVAFEAGKGCAAFTYGR